MGNRKTTYIIIAVILVLTIVLSIPSVTVAKKIERDPKFEYTTSLTGTMNRSDRANVYTTTMSVPDTARYIMKEKKPMSYSDLNNEQSINLMYDDHYVLIYKGEAGKTYVQVSSRKYIHRNGYYGLYRPYSPNVIIFYDDIYRGRGYYRTDSGRYGGGYGTTRNTSAQEVQAPKNNNKIRTDSTAAGKIRTNSSTSSSSRSIRSGSSSSRSSMGGGISFGK
ncbi:MAG: DUF4247 domain-containing protein [Firmicutes bacterium]|nr:DUF4247 domain-containing protein [Bacillota bacterium]